MLAVAGGAARCGGAGRRRSPGASPAWGRHDVPVIEADATAAEGQAGESGRHGRAEPGPAGAGTHRGAARSRAPRRQRQAGRRARGAAARPAAAAGSTTAADHRRAAKAPSGCPATRTSARLPRRHLPRWPTPVPPAPARRRADRSAGGATPRAGCQRPRHGPARRADDRGGRPRGMGALAKRVPELAGFQPRISKTERDGQAPLYRLRAGGLRMPPRQSRSATRSRQGRGLRPGRRLAL